jgi:dipeptidyl aminopeptidase/acylaminoacyl peptidase
MTTPTPLEERLRSGLAATLNGTDGPNPVWQESPARVRALREQAHRRRWRVRLLAVAALLVIGGAAGVGAFLLQSRQPEPAARSNGWFASSIPSGDPDGNFDIVYSKAGIPANVVIGRPGDGLLQTCPAFSMDGRKLAYQESPVGADDPTPWTLVIVELDDRGLPSLSSARRDPSDPALPIGDPPCFQWSPDGSRVGYLAASGIRTIDVDTGTDRVVAEFDLGRGSPDVPFTVGPFAWSPDGTQIAYTRNSGPEVHTSELWVAGLDGTQFRLVGAAAADELVSSISWSPDGTQVAIGGDGIDGPYFIRTVEVAADSRTVHEVDSWPADEGMSAGPLWSSDGSRLAYVHLSTLTIREPGDHVARQVPVVIEDGNDPARAAYVSGLAAWAASGDRILVCASDQPYFDRGVKFALALVDPAGVAKTEVIRSWGGWITVCPGSWEVIEE